MKQFNFLSTKTWSLAFALAGVLFFAACKKDAFNEKDALTAQQNLLQVKFNYDLALKNIDLQIQRVSDSAKFALINLQYRADSALERVKQSSSIAQLLQQYQNARLLALQADSLQRGTATLTDAIGRARKLWEDSVNLASTNGTNSNTILNALRKNYSLTFTDVVAGTGIAGATVSVIPYGSTTAISATTNANGTATFIGQIIDPGAFFSVSATGYGSILVREASLIQIGTVTSTVGTNLQTAVRGTNPSVGMYNIANTRNTIRGSVMGDLDLTNGDAMEAVVGHLVTFTTTQSTGLPAISVVYQFPAVSDASGNYSVSVPDGNFIPVYANNTRVQQRMYVNSWTDEDAATAVPRIATIGATIATGGAAVTNGSGVGYYFTLPADTVSNRTVIAPITNALNTTFTPSGTAPAFPYTNRNLGAPRTDSLTNYFFGSVAASLFLNNSSSSHQNDNSVVYSRKALYSPARPADTLAMTLVSLVPGWVVSAPAMRAVVDGTTGKIASFILARTPGLPLAGPTANAGGVFNTSVMFTPTGRQVFTNLQGLTGTYINSLATTVATANSTATISVTGGNSFYLPIEFRNTIQRDRTPR